MGKKGDKKTDKSEDKVKAEDENDTEPAVDKTDTKEVEDAEDDAPGSYRAEEVRHEPFAQKIFSLISNQQAANGLRHNDHLRYRQYCSRRLRRLRSALRFTCGSKRFKAVPFPANFEDARYLQIPLMCAERSWAYGVQLKADNAAAAQMNARWRHHSISRLAKAVKWAQFLESVCKVHGDNRTQLEAEAYESFMSGTYLVEKEEWSEASAKLTRCRKVCEHLSLASEQAEAAIFKGKVQELVPLIRECRFNLGMGYDDTDEGVPKASSAPGQAVSDMNYRGHCLAIPSEKVNMKLARCLRLIDSIEKPDGSSVNEKVNDTYGELSAEFRETLTEIHSDMIAAGADGQNVEWHMLEAFARELSLIMNVERNSVLLWNTLLKLDAIQDIAGSDARKICKPEEGVRYCDLLRDDVNNLKELPESTDAVAELLNSYTALVLNCRCFFLALCYVSVGKVLEAAALLDMLQSRIEEFALISTGPFSRLQPLFARLQDELPKKVAQWRFRGLARLSKEKATTTQDLKTQKLEEFTSWAVFPPRVREIPCKPLVFDLAFSCIEAPDFDELLPKNRDDQKGLFGRMASGIGGRLGVFMGRGK